MRKRVCRHMKTASAQSDQDLNCLLTEPVDTTECMNKERPGPWFVCLCWGFFFWFYYYYYYYYYCFFVFCLFFFSGGGGEGGGGSRFFVLLLLLLLFLGIFHFISSRLFIKGGRKPENPGKTHLTNRKQNLAFQHVNRARLEPQRWKT